MLESDTVVFPAGKKNRAVWHQVGVVSLTLLPGIAVAYGDSEQVQHAKSDLADVLTQPAFQPRQLPKSWLQQLWESHGASLLERFKETLRWMHDKLPDVEQPEWLKALGRFVEGVFSSIKSIVLYFSHAHWVLPALLLLALAIAGYRYRHQLALLFPARPTRSDGKGAVSDLDPEIDVGAVYRSGDTVKLLEAIRHMLRRAFTSRYKLARSISDRELMRRIARDELDSDVFKETAALFEASAFAGIDLDNERTRRLYEAYAHKRSKVSQ